MELQSYVATWLRGYVATELLGYGATWLRSYGAKRVIVSGHGLKNEIYSCVERLFRVMD